MQKFTSRFRGRPEQKPQPYFHPHEQEMNRLSEAGTAAQEQGATEQAMQYYQQGLTLARQYHDVRAEQFFLSGIGALLVQSRQYEQGEQFLREALEAARKQHQSVLIARSLSNLGELYAAQKDWAQAQTHHQQALDVARPTGDAATIVLALENLARDYVEQSNPSYATHLLKEAFQIAQKAQSPVLVAGVSGRMGEAMLAMGDRAGGRKWLEQGLHMSYQTGRNRLVLRWMMDLAGVDIQEGHYLDAMQRYEKAEELARRTGQQQPEFFLQLALNLGQVYQRLGDYTQALIQAERAHLHANELHDAKSAALAVGRQGLALQGLKRNEEAAVKLQEGLRYFEDGVLSDTTEKAGLLLALGRAQQRSGAIEEAIATFQMVLAQTDSEKNPVKRAEALQLLASVYTSHLEREVALKTYQEALALFENAQKLLSNVDDRVTRGLVLSNAANLYTDLGDLETARSFYEESIQIARDRRDR
ncbi:MAG: tetratricopeptide repeat protein, partial [Candidatus Methanoperedens sp.]|nr:tetratricopeptide repeat protein [Candidatus Methanoperedens sp.]